MRAVWLIAVAWMVCSSAQAASVPSPIAPAGQGRLQCYSPNVAHKTCQSLAVYKGVTTSAISDAATVLVSQSPPVTMTTVSPVVIKKNQVCETIRPGDIEAATFTIDNHPTDADQTAAFRQQTQTAMTNFFGHEICTTFVPDHGSLLAEITVDGTAQPSKTQKVMWVSPRRRLQGRSVEHHARAAWARIAPRFRSEIARIIGSPLTMRAAMAPSTTSRI